MSRTAYDNWLTENACGCNRNYITVLPDCDEKKDICDCQEIYLQINNIKTDVNVLSGDVENKLDISAYTPTDLSNYYTKEEVDELIPSIPSLSGYATEQWVENQGYLKTHQTLKTINGESLVGEGNIVISEGSTDLSNYYNKQETDNRFQPKGNYLTSHQPLKTINGQVISGTGNIVIEGGSGGSVTVDSALSPTSTNPVENKAIYGALNGKLDASAYTPTDLSNYYNKQEVNALIPTVPSNVSAFNNDAGYITSASTVFNNYATQQWVLDKHYLTSADTAIYYSKTEVDNFFDIIQQQIADLISDFGECCTAMTLEGTAIYRTAMANQIIDIGSTQIAILRRPNGTIVTPAADSKDTYSMPNNGQNRCTFRLIEGLTTLGSNGAGGITNFISNQVLYWSFNGGFTKVGSMCFANSPILQKVILPDTVTEINYCAFSGDSAITEITINATTPPTLPSSGIYKNALDDLNDVNTSFIIKVPASAVETYKAASGWSTYANRIQAIT